MEATSESDLKRLLRVVFKKKGLFLIIAAAVTTCIVIFSYLLPKTYEAKSVIFIERNVLNELIKEVTVTSSFEEKIKALSTVMKSRSLIMKVMSDLDIDINSRSADEIESSIQKFQENTKIDIEVNKNTRKDMDLFIVSYTDSDPKLASNFVNGLVRRYIEINLSMKREEAYGASQFLLDQISSFKVKLDKIEKAIAQQHRGKTTPDTSVPLYELLQSLVKRRNDLMVQYTENHPDVQKLKAEIAMVTEEMKKASPTASGPDIVLLDLERERSTIKKIYEDLLATLRKSEVATQIEVHDKAGAFRIIDPAVIPSKPLSPNMMLMIVLAIVGGIATSVAFLKILDATDNSIKSVDIVRKMGLPVLAVISTMQTEQEAAALKRKNKMIYTMAGLYVAVFLVVASLEAMGLSYIDDLIQGAKVEIRDTMRKI